MSPSKTRTSNRPLRSYLLRIVEQRVVSISTVYELHDITSGERIRFDSLDTLQRFLSQQRRRSG